MTPGVEAGGSWTASGGHDLVVPDYGGACIASVFPALVTPGRPAPWLPAAVKHARQVVLLVLDGLGWLQLQQRRERAPVLHSMEGSAIASVAPSTTSAALTSIVVGASPGEHGVVGYRVHVGNRAVLNVLRWTTAAGDATGVVPPRVFQTRPAFSGHEVPVVTKAEFARGGFTAAVHGAAPIVGYWVPSSIAVEVRRLLLAGTEYVYAYYDGLDKVAHAHGFGDHYDAELATIDRLVGDILESLVPGAALVITADHGQVEVAERIVSFDRDVLDGVDMMTGEGRFRWLHTRPGALGDVRDALDGCERDGLAWVRTRDEAVDEKWFGPVSDAALARMGDVAVAARAPVSFHDPAEGGVDLVCRHGSLTPQEMLVPLLASAG